jgi:tetratricopeptide (TPR) repeat protein
MRRLVWPLVALLVLAAAGGGWWWYTFTRPERRLQRGLEAARRGESDRAEQIAAALEAGGSPAHAALVRAEIPFRRARWSLDNGQRDEAVPDLRATLRELRRAEDWGPLAAEAAALGGQALFYLGQLRTAERALLFAVAERPDHADAHRALAALYYDQGALARALEHLEAVTRLDARDGRPARLSGLIHRDMSKPLEAIACYEEALRRELSSSMREEARTELAEILVQAGRFAQANEVLDCLDPEAAAKEIPTVLRAECLAGEERTERLRQVLGPGLRRHPRSSRLLRLQARLLVEEGRPEKALPLLEQAVESAPRDPAVRFQLGRLYRRLGREADAKEQDRRGEESRTLMVKMTELSHKASKNPWDAALRRQLAEICGKLGNAELEEMWRRSAEACGPPPRSSPARRP